MCWDIVKLFRSAAGQQKLFPTAWHATILRNKQFR